MKKTIGLILSLLVILQTFFLVSCEKKKEKFTDYSFDYFDTVTSIIGFEDSEEVFKENCAKIKGKLEEYHKLYTIYSRYDGINNLTVINETREGKHSVVKVDEKIIDMLQFAKKMYNITNGKVNVAMGSVLSIWHDYREEGLNNPEKARLPEISALKTAAKYTDINDLIIDAQDSSVYIANPEMTLDVGAVAKGYATEQVALWMEEEGISGYLLNVGGNIRTVGKRSDGEKWKIGIENPDTDDEENPYIEYLELDEMTLVTSGSYQRFYTVDGKNYHHIIDPDTLMPAENFKLVSVLCKDSGKADALSTALFSMNYEDGKALIESLEDTFALWVTNEDGKLYSKVFKNFCTR